MSADVALDAERQSFGPQPLISVLVPSYNHQNYIVQCLESIEHLSYKRLELIVSDDCSTDKTYEFAREWIHLHAARFERLVIVKQPKNLGVVKNIQFLFDSSEGDYLALLASDDLFVKSGVTHRLKILQEDETLDAVLGNSQSISSSGVVLEEQRVSITVAGKLGSRRLLTCALLKYWGVVSPSLMIKKRAVLEGGSLGFLPENLDFEDRYICIRLAAQGKLRYINAVVSQYRTVPNSLSRTPEFARIADKGVAESDRLNSHFVHGIERLYLEVGIARSRVKGCHQSVISHFIEQLLRAIGFLLWNAMEFRWRR